MQFIDLKAQQQLIREKIEENIKRVLDHGRYIMGPEITELEEKLAAYVGTRHAVGCASGTDALMMALLALEVGPGDAVFTSPFTFFATAEVVGLLGATPVFVDIDPATFNLDPAKLVQAIEAVNQGQTLEPRAVIGVDLFGLPADYDAINQIAAGHGLAVIEDAAQSLGGVYKGRRACSLAQMGCTSFFPAKPLGCYGDGGMVFCDDAQLDGLLRSLRVHGQGSDKYDNVRLGINGRLDTIQAAVLLAKLELLPREMEQRQEVAERYRDLMARAGLALTTPEVPEGYASAWAQYSVLAQSQQARQEFLDRLGKAGIPSAIYYPKPLHLQQAFAYLGHQPGDFPVSESAGDRVFSLPMHPYLAAGDQEKIVAALAG
ncbi:MAG: DegT/DnrJ/EryC1/StrS family aminotransferase [Proteobacteria bacterium]|nr:DegT/DnrJ/EryC1/StrS family aminotransferase [Pseudomonadota bacterium]MBU1451521.1 DegT/DnrJ/EryC1/StrS family aminotransferase [Pseudomonadota bacterium]MBU2469778.1 DegT/DnrJ/EryC1/StrS family aminotransferase [Pseudomonadota bacterium]MBU2518776.1 DegT/DnrJ/EryC1/StrS family aminotransferase [Pseudomonadota bacterium]